MKKVLLLLFLAAALAGFGLFMFRSNGQTGGSLTTGETHKMVLGESGYEPQNISIKKGDVIEFSTGSDKPFWPASDIHPTHGIYPEFDPQDAIQSGKTWSFKFEKVGTWRYHDHLYPYFTGKITVSD